MKQGELFFNDPAAHGEADPAPAPVHAPDAPSDAPARRLAVRDFTRPLLLEAGAGTGKTATLVGRVVTWALGPGWEEVAAARDGELEAERIAPLVLEGISAITFTEAAAAELSTRVGRVLRDLEMAGEDELPIGLERCDLPAAHDEWSVRARALRASLDRLTACTIHAFCRRLLAAHPLELGLDPYFELDARMTRVPMCVREVLEEFFQERWGNRDEADLLELARRGHGPPQIEAAMLDLMDAGARSEDFREPPLPPAACSALTTELEESLRELAEYRTALAGVPKNQKTHVLLNALSDALALVTAGAGESAPAALFDSWQAPLDEIFDDNVRDKLKTWRKGKFTKNETKHIEGAASELMRCAERFETALAPLLELDREHLERVRGLCSELLGRIETRVRARGLTTFNDLLRDARRLLVNFPEVAAAERRRIRQLLVDEFQDTDAGQCELVRQLALRGPVDERPTLFCVGDPKQSIYAWRHADLMAYDTFAKELEAAGGEILRLTCNFRSVPGILQEVDRALAPVMERIEGVQPEFIGLEAHRGELASGRAPIEVWPSWPLDEDGAFVISPSKRVQAGYEAEAAAIAMDVARLSSEGAAFRDVALLFRATTGVEVYLRALRERAIPYLVQSDRTYYKRREVIDAGALVRCVLDPVDQLALVTLLRSPWVGVPDAALFALWSAGFPGVAARWTYIDERLETQLEEAIVRAEEALPEVPAGEDLGGWGDSLRTAMVAIIRLRGAFETETSDRWIEMLRRFFQPEAIESARFLGAFRRSNLERFFRELETALEERGDVHSVLASLRTSLGREVEAEVTRPSDSEVDAVRVLTIHGSKGLEFDHVYLAQGHRLPPGGKGADMLFEKRGDKLAYTILGARNPGYFEARKRSRLSEAAERVRLLYVALTRAKERLVVLGAFAAEPKRETWQRTRTFTELLEHRAGLEEALTELRRASPDHEHTDEHGCLFRSAVGISRNAPPDSITAPTPEERGACARLPSLASMAEDARLLGERRRAARARSARPWSLSASSTGHGPEPGDRHVRAGTPGPLTRRAARAVGVAVHRVLELCDLEGNPEVEFARGLARSDANLEELLGTDELAPARERARVLLEGMCENGLWTRYFGLRDVLVARELEVLLPPEAANTDLPPTGFVSGVVDLLYRCPETNALVIADYKSDLVADGAELEERVASYRDQGRTYVRALHDALELELEPRFELWFLHLGRVVPVTM